MERKKRRAFFIVVTAVLVLLLVEGIGRLGYRLATGEPYARAALVEQRRSLLKTAAVPLGQAVTETGRRRVPHPFLGSVLRPDPQASVIVDRYRAVAGEDGFYHLLAGEAPTEGHAVVAMFGGSVATVASFASREALSRRLEPLLGRPLAFRSRALGAYKQPQQLLTLTYFLSLGESYDIVLNLDGVNEAILPMLHHRRNGVFPFYPQDWPTQMEAIDDPARRLRLGELVVVEGERRHRAELFEIRPLSAFAPWNLLWRVLDDRSRMRLAEIQGELADLDAHKRPYRSHGPPWQYAGENRVLAALARQWATASLQMHRLCAANGIRYIHFLQPNQYVPGSKPLHPEEERLGVTSRAAYERLIGEAWPLFQQEGEALRQQGVEFVDLTMLFADTREPVYRDDCCHMNPRGHEILAEAMAEAVAATTPPARSVP